MATGLPIGEYPWNDRWRIPGDPEYGPYDPMPKSSSRPNSSGQLPAINSPVTRRKFTGETVYNTDMGGAARTALTKTLGYPGDPDAGRTAYSTRKILPRREYPFRLWTHGADQGDVWKSEQQREYPNYPRSTTDPLYKSDHHHVKVYEKPYKEAKFGKKNTEKEVMSKP